MKKSKPVILGLGNPLFQDEGLGIHMIHKLMNENITRRAELIDGGTDALALLGIVEEAEYLLIIDAVNADANPGSIRRFVGEEIPLCLAAKISVHQIGFQEVLALARLRRNLPAHLVLLGVQPQSLGWGTELTETVAASLPRLTEMVYEQIDRWIK
ncbi:MAG: HyaD/HybD family hydrogenase maturation endopeptidase [Syntrophomonadaceae bacterium]|jgi:hydrogenase maturation protease